MSVKDRRRYQTDLIFVVCPVHGELQATVIPQGADLQVWCTPCRKNLLTLVRERANVQTSQPMLAPASDQAPAPGA